MHSFVCECWSDSHTDMELLANTKLFTLSYRTQPLALPHTTTFTSSMEQVKETGEDVATLPNGAAPLPESPEIGISGAKPRMVNGEAGVSGAAEQDSTMQQRLSAQSVLKKVLKVDESAPELLSDLQHKSVSSVEKQQEEGRGVGGACGVQKKQLEV